MKGTIDIICFVIYLDNNIYIYINKQTTVLPLT